MATPKTGTEVVILQSSDIEIAGQDFPEFAAPLRLAYHSVPTDPGNTCGKARLILEQIVQGLYLHTLQKPLPSRARLSDLLKDDAFRQAVPDSIYATMQEVRRAGNDGVHNAVLQKDAVDALTGLVQVLRWYKEKDIQPESATNANTSGLGLPNVREQFEPQRERHPRPSLRRAHVITDAISQKSIAPIIIISLVIALILALGFWGIAAFACALFFQQQLVNEDKTVWMFTYISAAVGGVVGIVIALVVVEDSVSRDDTGGI